MFGKRKLLAISLLAVWVKVEQKTTEPLVNMRTLAQRTVLTTDIATFLVGFGLFGSFVLIPQLAQLPKDTGYGFGLNATEAGLLLAPSALLNLFLSPLSGRMGGRLGAPSRPSTATRPARPQASTRSPGTSARRSAPPSAARSSPPTC